MSKLRIRPAVEGDLDRLARLWRDSAASSDGVAEVPSVVQLRLRMDRELAAGWDLRLAECDGVPVGLLALKLTEGVLDQLYVAPDAQGSGVGRALLNAARTSLPGGFTLRAAEANVRAHRFYEHEGLALAGQGKHPSAGFPVRWYAFRPN